MVAGFHVVQMKIHQRLNHMMLHLMIKKLLGGPITGQYFPYLKTMTIDYNVKSPLIDKYLLFIYLLVIVGLQQQQNL